MIKLKDILICIKKHSCEAGVIAAFYLFLSLITTHSIVFSPVSKIIGNADSVDFYGSLWYHWLGEKIINAPGLLFKTDYIFYPCYFNAYTDLYNLPDVFLAVLLRMIFGFPLYYNILINILFTLNGLSGFAMGKYFYKDKNAALLTGTIFAFNPYLAGEAAFGRTTQLTAFLVPIFLIALVAHMKNPSFRTSVFTGLAIWGVSLCYWGYSPGVMLIFCILFIIKIKQGSVSVARKTVYFSFTLIIFTLLALPLTLPFFHSWVSKGIIFPIKSMQNFNSVGTSDYFFNSASRFSLGLCSLVLNHNLPKLNYMFGVSYILLAALFFSLFIRENTNKFAVSKKISIFFIVLFFILTLGPVLKIFPSSILMWKNHHIPMPYLWVSKILPFFHRFIFPYRFSIFLFLFLSIITGNFYCILRRKYQLPEKTVNIITVLICILIVIEPMVRGFKITTSELEPSEIDLFLKNQKGIVIELPMEQSSQIFWRQMFHEKKLINGMSYFFQYIYPPDYKSKIVDNSFLKYIDAVVDIKINNLEGPYLETDLEKFQQLKIDWIVIRKNYFNDDFTYYKMLETISSIFNAPVFTSKDGEIFCGILDFGESNPSL